MSSSGPVQQLKDDVYRNGEIMQLSGALLALVTGSKQVRRHAEKWVNV